LVESGIANGSLDPRIDIDIAAFVLNAVFTELGQHLMQRFGVLPDQLLVSGADAFDHDDVRRAIHQVITILETGLRKK
ncbi:MAG: TetR/AcrR family transcriptional regulator, partial [Phototrophicales bacterium]